MATLYQRPNSPYYYAQFFDADGRRSSRSTKKTLKREAQREAARLEAETRDKRSQNSHLPRAYQAVIEGAARDAADGSLTLVRSEELVKHLHRLANPSFEVQSLEVFFTAWIEEQSDITSSTRANYRNALVAFRDALVPKAMAAPVGDLTEDQVRRAIQAMRSKTEVQTDGKPRKVTRRASTINGFLAVLRGALAVAVSRGLATANVAKTVKRLKTSDSRERAPFDPREVRLLIDEASRYKPFVRKGIADEWAGAVTIAAHTGLRCCDVLALSRGNIEGDKVVVQPQKTVSHKTTVVVPMTPAVVAWIGKRRGQFFPKLSKQLPGTTSEQFKALMRAVEVPRTLVLPGGIEADRSFHSLRHSFVSWLSQGDIHAEIRKKLAGHTTSKHHDIYTHLDDESLQQAIKALPAL